VTVTTPGFSPAVAHGYVTSDGSGSCVGPIQAREASRMM